MMQRLARQLFTADALGILFVIAALQILPFGIAASVSVNIQYFSLICLVAAGIGYGWSKTQRNGIQASAEIAALGILFVWILGARLTQPLLNLVSASFTTLMQFFQTNLPLDTSSIQSAWAVIASASLALWLRVQTWLTGFASGSVNDALIRNLVWILLHWLVTAWMGWHVEKRKALTAFLPPLLLLAVVTAYSEKRVEYLLALLVILLLLMGIWHYKAHTTLWTKSRFDFSESIPLDMGQAVILITFAFALLAAITPSLSWDDLVEFIQKRNNDSTAEMLGVQPPIVAARPIAASTPSMPRDHLLTGGFANSEKLVMSIRTGELPPLPTEMLPMPAPRYYWRSLVYDQYLGTGWGTSTVGKQKITAGTPLLPVLLNEYRLVNLDVQMVEPEGKLFWSGILFNVDVPFTAQWRLRPTSDLFADQTTLLQSDIFSATSEVTAYRAEVYIPNPTISELRSASTEYPEAILERYLVLPRELPDRVRTLALDITDGKSNPYEKAKAIESYLRTNYPYDLEVPAPPVDRDVTEYFLFELKKGYCDYYATAMVVLARANGLPARFVSGYAPGFYDAPNAQYVIRELNAHSWAEIYFPGIGWVEFEPTASIPEIERTETNIALPEDSARQESAARTLTIFRLEQILIWSSPVLSLFALALIYFFFIERWLYLRLEPNLAIHRIYQSFYRSGKKLTGEISQAETSSEYLDRVSQHIKDLQSKTRYKKLFGQARENAQALTSIYHHSLFMDYQTSQADSLSAWRLWTSLRYQLLVAQLLSTNNKRSRK